MRTVLIGCKNVSFKNACYVCSCDNIYHSFVDQAVNCHSVMARHNHIAVHSQIPVTNGFLISAINLSYASTAQSISVDKNVTLTHGGDNHMK